VLSGFLICFLACDDLFNSSVFLSTPPVILVGTSLEIPDSLVELAGTTLACGCCPGGVVPPAPPPCVLS
jgi:fucose permease